MGEWSGSEAVGGEGEWLVGKGLVIGKGICGWG